MLELTVGEFVKRRRIELNLTQAELAEKINSDTCYISRVETGARKPTVDNLAALANALEVSSDYLLGLNSNIVLHEHVSDMEKVLQSLTLKKGFFSASYSAYTSFSLTLPERYSSAVCQPI